MTFGIGAFDAVTRQKASKLRITPIGTCRIHTPLRRGTARYPIEMDMSRNFGFVHTSEEALQLVQFLQGEKQFRSEVAPLVFRQGDMARAEAEQWQPSDLYLVEISLGKLIRSGSDAVQANYIMQHFADFFANFERLQKFWALARKGDRSELLAYVREEPSFQRLSAADRQLLVSLSVEQQSSASLRNDMAEIVERLGKDKVVFVTHVNAVTPDGGVIPKRGRLIRLVKLAAEELGVAVFDPTELMRKFGQERALEKDGFDLAHYTPAFSDELYDAVHSQYVRPLTGADGATDDQAVDSGRAAAAQLGKLLDGNDFEAAARKIHQALADNPDSIALAQLRGLVRFRIGDYRGASDDFSGLDQSGLPHEVRIAVMDTNYKVGRYSEALKVAEDLIGDEYEDAAVYGTASAAAEKLGDTERAVAYAKQSFRHNHDDLAAGLRALGLIGKYGTADETREWRDEILGTISETSIGAFEIGLWAVEHRDDAMFAAALAAIGTSDKATSIDLLEAANQASMLRGVADSIGLAAALGRLPPELARRRVEIFRWAAEEASWAFEQGRSAEAYHAARALAELSNSSNSQLRTTRFGREALRLMRAIERQTRIAIREAFGRGDEDAVIRIGQDAREILGNDPEAALILVRSLHSADRHPEALALLKEVLAKYPNHFSLRRWAARLTALAEDHATALEMYAGLDRADPLFEQVRPEVERYFSTAEARTLRQLRNLIDADRIDDALHLADAIRRHLGWSERQEREITRMYRGLWARLKEVEETTGELEEREPILRYMTQIKPDDPVALRRLALEFMRQFRFGEAADCWERLIAIAPDYESAVRSQERCRMLAARKAGSPLTEVAA